MKDDFLVLFLNLDIFLKTSTPGELAYIRQIKRVGIITPRFKERSVFTTVAVVAS